MCNRPYCTCPDYDALLAERDALKAELVTERRWAERMKSPELLRTVLVNELADQIDALKIENDEADTLNTMLSRILTDTAHVLKGTPEALHSHSWADLAQVAAALKAENATAWGEQSQVAFDCYALTQRVLSLRAALERLSCLGNGDRPGNSEGNVIALAALVADGDAPDFLTPRTHQFVCPTCGDNTKADEDGCCKFCGEECTIEPLTTSATESRDE